MILFFYFLLNKLLAKLRFSQYQLNLLVYKMGKKPSCSTEQRIQIVSLSNLMFSVHQIPKKMFANFVHGGFKLLSPTAQYSSQV